MPMTYIEHPAYGKITVGAQYCSESPGRIIGIIIYHKLNVEITYTIDAYHPYMKIAYWRNGKRIKSCIMGTFYNYNLQPIMTRIIKCMHDGGINEHDLTVNFYAHKLNRHVINCSPNGTCNNYQS